MILNGTAKFDNVELNFLHHYYIDYILDNMEKKLEFTESAIKEITKSLKVMIKKNILELLFKVEDALVLNIVLVLIKNSIR